MGKVNNGVGLMKSIIPEGECIYSLQNKDFSENYFWGHCARCGNLIGSFEDWYEDTDHCVNCQEIEDDEE
jgi:hypothetical protein